MPRRSVPFSARLWAHIDKKSANDCWLWKGAKTHCGYGYISRDGTHIRAHRAAYEDAIGPIPEGLCVLHKCDVPRCCNPAHLWVGTQADNMADMRSKGRGPGNNGTGVGLKGFKNPNAKLTAPDILAIRAAPGAYKIIAAKYGVAVKTVCRIKTGKRWADVTLPTDDLT